MPAKDTPKYRLVFQLPSEPIARMSLSVALGYRGHQTCALESTFRRCCASVAASLNTGSCPSHGFAPTAADSEADFCWCVERAL